MADLHLDSQDLRGLLATASAVREAPGDHASVVELLAALARIVRCDVAFWHWLTLRPEFRTVAYVQDPTVDAFVPAREPWLEHLPEHPIMSGRNGRVVAISDVWSDREFRETWLYQEVFSVDGLRHEIGVELAERSDVRNVVVLSRMRGDFSALDHDVLELLRPHLSSALTAWGRPSASLTARQVEVLRLVGEGLSDAQIARRLGLSESTVGKHLEHVYARSGAHSRVQAVRLLADRT
ncbi:MAG TPA: helix-turn-helix transcriptional regulator [Jiangellales bacterium]|nr:helix-turn-helix transcriptional regulator [Jiangellales bacterium]